MPSNTPPGADVQELAITLHRIQCGCNAYIGIGDEDEQYEISARLLIASPFWEGTVRAAKEAAWDEGYGDDLDCHVPRENPYRVNGNQPQDRPEATQ